MAWEVVERSGQSHLPVVRQDGSCAGLLERAELAVACADPAVTLSRRSVRDLVRGRRTVTVHPEEPALRAAAVMTEEHRDALPVTDPARAADRPAHGAGLRGRRRRPAPHGRAGAAGAAPAGHAARTAASPQGGGLRHSHSVAPDARGSETRHAGKRAGQGKAHGRDTLAARPAPAARRLTPGALPYAVRP